MLAFTDCLWRGNLMFIYRDLLGKSWFPNQKHTLIVMTLRKIMYQIGIHSVWWHTLEMWMMRCSAGTFKQMNWVCLDCKTILLVLLHIQKLIFCYQNCSDLLWEKIVLMIEKNFWNSRLKIENFQNFEITRSIFRTVKGQNNFW